MTNNTPTTNTKLHCPKFTSLKWARSLQGNIAEETGKWFSIIMGGDMKFWVVTPAQGERLVRQGYERATFSNS